MRWISKGLAGFLVIGLLVSCMTYKTVTEAPIEFWTTAEAILAAVVQDFWALVDLLL